MDAAKQLGNKQTGRKRLLTACCLIAASLCAPNDGMAKKSTSETPNRQAEQAGPAAAPAATPSAAPAATPSAGETTAKPEPHAQEPQRAQEPQPAQEPQRAEPQRAEPQRAMETPAVVIDGSAADTLLGKPVQSPTGEGLGRVVDVVVDRGGLLRAAIVDFGGFLGVGTRKIAVDWHVLHFPETGRMDKLIADLQRDQLRNAPVFKEGEPLVVIGAANVPVVAPTAPPSPAPAEKP